MYYLLWSSLEKDGSRKKIILKKKKEIKCEVNKCLLKEVENEGTGERKTLFNKERSYPQYM